jgi:predicted ATP-binding protein involved in virulence
MYIKRICAKNFKAFDYIEINTDGKSLVIFGVNGVGKSTILSIVDYTFWNMLNRLNPSQSTAYKSFDDESVRYGDVRMLLQTDVMIDDNIFSLIKIHSKSPTMRKGHSSYPADVYDKFVDYIKEKYLDKDKDIPIFVNYGTNRYVKNISLEINKNHKFSKLASLEQAYEVDFGTFFEWYRNQEDIENEKKIELGDLSYKDKSLECVRRAVLAMLGKGYSDLKIMRSPLCMKVKKGDMDLSVNQLSDGEKCIIALFGDLARRLALANPNRNNALEGSGVVLIDEIELHMHPSWQRRVLGVLKEVFPNIQFIVTTHSPQVLGEADDRYKVIGLYSKEDNSVCISEEYIYGKDSNGVLKNNMDTPIRSEAIQSKFDNFYKLLDEEKFENAEKILEDINNLVADNDPELASCWIKLKMEQM